MTNCFIILSLPTAASFLYDATSRMVQSFRFHSVGPWWAVGGGTLVNPTLHFYRQPSAVLKIEHEPIVPGTPYVFPPARPVEAISEQLKQTVLNYL